LRSTCFGISVAGGANRSASAIGPADGLEGCLGFRPNERALFLTVKLKEKGGSYLDLVKRLKKRGFTETEASFTNKLKRGTFSATFFLACLAAMELESVVLEEI
jgi:hypothetical protein